MLIVGIFSDLKYLKIPLKYKVLRKIFFKNGNRNKTMEFNKSFFKYFLIIIGPGESCFFAQDLSMIPLYCTAVQPFRAISIFFPYQSCIPFK